MDSPSAPIRPLLGAAFLCLLSATPLHPQVAPEIENLRAFAKLFGYVRYFHPSDAAAAVSWEAFAVHGARRVKAARTADDLRRIFESLFQPIAPTVQIFPAGSLTPGSLIERMADTAGTATVAWQHMGLGQNPQSVYRSVRLNRLDPMSASEGYGVLTGSIDAAPHRGRAIRLRGWVRTDVTGPGNQGQLWLRVDRPGQERGFFDNMDDRPITASDWQPYEIVGDVADDATRIAFGAFLRGRGAVWLDGFELSVSGPGNRWTTIALDNPGFEEADDAGKPRGWSAASQGYVYTLESAEAREGSRALAIRQGGPGANTALFAARPRLGEAVVKPLGAGLAARIPLALATNDTAAHGSTAAPAFRALMTALRAVGLDTLGPGDEGLRLADVIIAWNVFQHFYPYFDVVPTNWDAELTTALSAALGDRTPDEFLLTLERLIAALHDGHARVTAPWSPQAALPLRVEWIEDQVVVTAAAGPALRPGDIVLALDGRDARELVRERETTISGSPQWKRYRATRELGLGKDSSEAVLRVRRGQGTMDVTLRRRAGPGVPERTGPPVRELQPGIWYVDLDRAEMADINSRIGQLAGARGVIFDLRGYPRGNHAVLSHLLTAADTSTAWMHVPMAVYPDRERPAGTRPGGWRLQPAEPHIAGRVVFLTDGRAISYAESFMSFVEHYRLAEIVGQPTAGTNGNVNMLTLPGGFRIPWTGMRVVKHDGSQHHLVGIQPTIPVTRTIEAVREGRDEFVERALAVIRAGGPAPR